MPRPSKINDLVFRKCPDDANHSIRDKVYALAKDGERVGDLIVRAVGSGIGNLRQVRAAIILGAKSKGSKFKLEARR